MNSAMVEKLYEGERKNGKCHGEGRLYGKNDKLRYDGHGNVESRAKKVIGTAGAGK